MTIRSEYIRAQCYQMKEGERLRIECDAFNRAFPCGWPSIYETSEQAFLSGMIGSAWGTFTVTRDIVTGDVTICRNPAGDKRVYCDPDREHWFRRTPDGYLELRGKD